MATRYQQSSSHPPPPSTPSILSRLPLDFSRKTLFYLRLLAFFIVEAGYIILAAVCLARPITLKVPLSLTDAEVKGGFTVIFVVWQILAIFIASDLVTDAFSREWSAQLEKSNPGMSGGPPVIVPVGIDRVSTITSGFLDRAHHLFLDKSSGSFKLAFLASLLFLALRSLGPGTINVGTALIDEPTTVAIGGRPHSFLVRSDFSGGCPCDDGLVFDTLRAGYHKFQELIEIYFRILSK